MASIFMDSVGELCYSLGPPQLIWRNSNNAVNPLDLIQAKIFSLTIPLLFTRFRDFCSFEKHQMNIHRGSHFWNAFIGYKAGYALQSNNMLQVKGNKTYL